MPEVPTAAGFVAHLLNAAKMPQAFATEEHRPTGRVTSRWHGTGEALGKLGLRHGAEVRERELAAVVSGRHARTGKRLLPEDSAFEFVFKVPNSVSWVWGMLSAPDRAPIEDAAVESAAFALDRLMTENPVIGGDRPARSFAAALILHAIGTLSAPDGKIPPALHVHCFLFGVLDDDGTFVAPHDPTMYDEDLMFLTNTLAEASLADRLVDMGYSVRNTAETGVHCFEIKGVPQELLDEEFWQYIGCAVAGSD